MPAQKQIQLVLSLVFQALRKYYIVVVRSKPSSIQGDSSLLPSAPSLSSPLLLPKTLSLSSFPLLFPFITVLLVSSLLVIVLVFHPLFEFELWVLHT